MKKYLSIRTLTAIGFFAISLLTAGGAYLMIENEVRKNLQIEFDALLVNYALDIKQIILDKSGFNLLNLESEESLEDKIFPFPHGKALIQLIDTSGLVLTASQSLGDARIPIDIEEKDAKTENFFSDFEFSENNDDHTKPYRSVRIPFVQDHDVIRGYLMVAVPADFVELQEKRLKTALLQAVPVFLFLSLLMSWIISRGVTAAIFRLVVNVKNSQQHHLQINVDVPTWPHEVRELAEAFQELVLKLQDAAKRQEEFFLVAAHQLKTPLFIVRNELMSVDGIGEKARAKLVERMNVLSSTLQKILDFGRASYDFSEEQMTEIHLLDIVSDVVVRLSPNAEKKQILVRVTNHDDMNFVIKGEETLIEQAIQNLVDNAIFWSPIACPIEIIISGENDKVKISILDQGPGVHPDVLEKIFTPFGNDPMGGGTGLGLALVQRVARLHGGTISYRRENNRTVFELILPLSLQTIKIS